MAEGGIVGERKDFQNKLKQMLEKNDEDCVILKSAYDLAKEKSQGNAVIKQHFSEIDQEFLDEVENRIADLDKVERPILVIGETSAGKSSFLNLFIGKEVLPESDDICTKCTFRIKKGQTLEAHVFSDDGSTPVQIISSEGLTDSEFQEQLETVMEKTMDFKGRIDIFAPSNILEGNICLVDTPGLCDSGEVTQMLFEYVPSAMGVIFILNSTVHVGMANDRGALILDEIKELRRQKRIPSFDPSKVIFVANKWDQIKKKTTTHLEKMRKKINDIWPAFQEDRILPLSVSYMQDVQKDPTLTFRGYESAHEDYKRLLDKIQETVQHCANAKSRVHLRFIQTFLKDLNTRIKAMEDFSKLDPGDKEKKISDFSELTEKLKDKQSEAVKGLKVVEKEKREIIKDMNIYLTTTAMNEKLSGQVYSVIPGEKAKKRIQIQIRRSIVKELDSYMKQESFVWKTKGLSSKVSQLEQSFKTAENEIKVFLNNIGKVSQSAEVITPYSPPEDETFGINIQDLLYNVLTSPIWIPLGIATRVYDLVTYQEDVKHWIKDILKEEFSLKRLEENVFSDFNTAIEEKRTFFKRKVGNYISISKHLAENETEDAAQCTEMREIYNNLIALLTEISD